MADQEDTKTAPVPAANEPTKEDIAKLEKDQETKLKSKYPMLKGPGRQALLQKQIFQKQKYFDSGDYALAKARPSSKLPMQAGGKFLLPNVTSEGQHPTPESVKNVTKLHSKSKLAAPNNS